MLPLEKNKSRAFSPLVWADIHLDRLQHNLRLIRRMAKGSKCEILAVVKADAYGHGMEHAALTLQSAGIRFFGVATLEEALQLRRACPKTDILVLGSVNPSDAGVFIRNRITPTLSCWDDWRALEASAGRNASFPVHVKIDTGMGRLGVWHEQALPFFLKARQSGRLRIEGVYTHLSSTDEACHDFTSLQLHRFETLIEKLKLYGMLPRWVHAANSLGLVRYRSAHLNLVRPGILLYGLNPWPNAKLPLPFKPVMTLRTRISFLKEVPAGQPISYGRTFLTAQKTKIATLPIGYSHGFRVGLSNRSQVLVRGRLCPVVGRITMDQTLIDVSDAPSVRRWDEVTIFGDSQAGSLSAEELAKTLNTIPYEIVCGIHSKVLRVYKGVKSKK